MATRSFIAIKLKDESYKGVYCHFDGYPAGVGNVLALNYKQPRQAKAVVNKGYISTLRAPLKESEFFVDRGEDLMIDYLNSEEELIKHAKRMHCEWIYLFENNLWTVCKL